MTEVITTNNSTENKSENHMFANDYHCVEIKPIDSLPIYQFKLHPHLDLNMAYVLIGDHSEILKHLKTGQKIDMLYHPKNSDAPVEKFKTEIVNITKNEGCPFRGHYKVALSIEV